MEKIGIYMMGPLFGIADRHHNLLLSRELETLGYEVVLPQTEALNFFMDGLFDTNAIARDCRTQSMQRKVALANIDGPAADDGTAFEAGIAHATALLRKRFENRPILICIRTDFRTVPEKEVGINAMFNLSYGIIYKPAFATTIEEVAVFYKELAAEISEKIEKAIKGLD
jgi:hypothetical protein